VRSLVDLTLVAEHRRGHGAMYDALCEGRVEPQRLCRSLASLPLPRAAQGRIVLAVDVSPWLRSDAPTSSDRLFCHVYGRGKGQAQLIPGWPYSFVAALEPGRTSWTALLDAARLGPADDITAVTPRLHADPEAVRKDLPDLCEWMLGTGVRIGEALAVSWAEVDIAAGTVRIEHTLIRLTGVGLPRKGTKPPQERERSCRRSANAPATGLRSGDASPPQSCRAQPRSGVPELARRVARSVLPVRRLVCVVTQCEQRTFREQVPELALHAPGERCD
jgi:hypothetical protein